MNLVCKVCDGNDFVMDGEYIVCQTCGTKYTIETARKLLGKQVPQATTRSHAQLEDFTIRAGVLFGYTGISRVVEIPDVVLDIAEQAFSGSAISEVSIPASVKSIGPRAFSGCRNLETVTIAEGVTSIGTGCFSACTSLRSVSFPSSVAAIEE
ncbi:MAG: leucine-rich repeat protein, partial [Eggerthellaceae bacterium]|nr:leucine-rich repeat protein [Eggerthellaceae bacterium]